MQIFLYLGPLIAFIVTFLSTPLWIRYLKKVDLVSADQNKKNKPLIVASGGVAALAGMLAGLMVYVFVQTFYYQTTNSLIIMFAATTTIILITFVGFLDDLIVNKHIGESVGLRQWQKPLLTILTAVPLVVINAGHTVMTFPILGKIDVGLMYPLLFVPIGIVGAANMVNILGGFNGMEAGMGLVYTGMLSIYAYSAGRYSAAAIGAIAFASLLAFYYYNKYPAKIMPGDSLTYFLGAVIVSIAIVGNIEKAALIASIPFFIEFVLKARAKFNAKSYGFYKNGKIMSWHGDKIYSIPHIFSRTGKFTEKQITFFMILIQLFFSSLIWVL